MKTKRQNDPDIVPNRRRDTNSAEAGLKSRQALFQRNRTLTMQTQDQSSHPSNIRSPRTNTHRLTLQRRKVGTMLILALAVVSLLLWLLTQLSAQVSVSTSDTTQTSKLEPATYESAVQDYLNANPIGRLRFALDIPGLEAYMNVNLPEVDHIESIRMGSIGEAKVVLAMRKPVAGWNINGKQLYVDAEGVAFDKNYYKNPEVQIIDNTGITPDQGATVASNRLLEFVGRIVASAKQKGYTVTHVVLPKDTTRQVELRIAESSSVIKLSIDRSTGEQAEDFARALVYLTSVGRTPGYIDVRVSGKAFYQ